MADHGIVCELPATVKPKLTTTGVAKSLLGWAQCTLRQAIRDADAFFQLYKHAREDNERLRSEFDHSVSPKQEIQIH